MKNALLVLTPNQEDYERTLRSMDLPDLEVFVPRNEAQIEEILPRANILLAEPPIAKRYINRAEKVVWMQSSFAGIDAMIDPSLRQDYLLTNNRDTYGEPIAEYVLGYLLMFEKEILENLEAQRNKEWNRRPSRMLAGKTLGILGLGSIGRCVAKAAKAFGMRVVGSNTSGSSVENVDRMYSSEDVTEMIRECDYVVSILPSTPKTRKLVDKKLLSELKSSAVFINVGRGDAVVEEDLDAALRAGKLQAAVLDVFEREPLAPESPLWSAPNLYVTPHISGCIVSKRTFEIFEENYRRFVRGEELRYRVDFQRGY